MKNNIGQLPKIKTIFVGAVAVVITATVMIFSLMMLPAVSFAATIDDEADLFSNTAEMKSDLRKLEEERGLNVIVQSFPESETGLDMTEEADLLRGDSDNTIAIVLQADTNKLGVSFGKRVTHTMSRSSLDKIIDKEMIPLLQEGKYDESVLQLVESVNFFMGLEGETEEASSSWFAVNKLPLAVAVASFLLFFTGAFFFVSKRSESKAAEFSEALAAEKQKRLVEVQNFWSSAEDSVKERFIEAANKAERETVMSELFDSQSFAEDNSRLTNLVGSFMYPGKVEKSRSIKYFLDIEEQTEELRADTLKMWESLTDDQRASFRLSSSESHSKALVSKLFPNVDSSEMVSRLTIMVPDSKSTDPNYMTYVDEKMSDMLKEDEKNSKPKIGLISKLFGLGK